VPEEITPLVRSLNEMLSRLSLTIDMQKRFIADAAHQMRTPLAGMRMQSELALRQTDKGEIHRSLEQLAKSSEAATRLVNQLLALARAENQPQAGSACSRWTWAIWRATWCRTGCRPRSRTASTSATKRRPRR
jgi:two-component system sensor histidine kinase TctE